MFDLWVPTHYGFHSAGTWWTACSLNMHMEPVHCLSPRLIATCTRWVHLAIHQACLCIPTLQRVLWQLLPTVGLRWLVQDPIKWKGFDFLYMPVWSLEELEKCRIAMYPDMAVAEFRSRFDHWGGIPRFVLAQLSDANQRLLVQAIASATLSDIVACVGHTFAHPDVSHRILHLHVEADFVTTSVRWASLWVAEEVAMRLFENEKNNLITFLSTSAVERDLAGLRGVLWEAYCHRRLAAGGNFNCRNLVTTAMPVDGAAEVIAIEPSSDCHIFESWPEVRNLPLNVYIRPRIKNLSAVDSVMQPDKLCQITVSLSHTINCKGLLQALSGMQADICQVSLFFVVPTDKFQSFKAQNIARGAGVDALRNDVQQFVLEVSLTK